MIVVLSTAVSNNSSTSQWHAKCMYTLMGKNLILDIAGSNGHATLRILAHLIPTGSSNKEKRDKEGRQFVIYILLCIPLE